MLLCFFFFFFNDTATTEIYTLSLHDALPIFFPRGESQRRDVPHSDLGGLAGHRLRLRFQPDADRKSTRLNSSHLVISYAVFCLKKKKKMHEQYEVFDMREDETNVHNQRYIDA